MDVNSKVSFVRNLYQISKDTSNGFTDIEGDLTGFPIKKVSTQIGPSLNFSLDGATIGRDDLNGGSSNEREVETIGGGVINAGRKDIMTIEKTWIDFSNQPTDGMYKTDTWNRWV